MKAQVSALFLIILILLTTGVLMAQGTQKFGYVNSSKIMQDFSESQDAQKQISAFELKIQDSVNVMKTEYQTKAQEYQQKKNLLNDQAKTAMEQQLIALEQKYTEFQDRKYSRDGELAQYTQKVLQPIKEKVLKVISQVAKDEKLTFIFDQNDALNLLLYSDPKFDYTNLVLDRLKRGGGK